MCHLQDPTGGLGVALHARAANSSTAAGVPNRSDTLTCMLLNGTRDVSVPVVRECSIGLLMQDQTQRSLRQRQRRTRLSHAQSGCRCSAAATAETDTSLTQRMFQKMNTAARTKQGECVTFPRHFLPLASC